MAKLSRFVKELGQGGILVPHLNMWFASNKEHLSDDIWLPIRFHKPGDDAFHPSSHALDCERHLSHLFRPDTEVMANPNFQTSAMQKTFINGHMWHALIQWVVCKELGFCEEHHIEQRLGVARPEPDTWAEMTDPGHLIEWRNWERPPNVLWWGTGSADISRCTVPEHGDYLVDIKTMNQFEYGRDRPSLWNKYVAQVQLYMDWKNIDRTIVLGVESASPFNFREIVVERDPEIAHLIYAKWDRVALAVREGRLLKHTCADVTKCAAQGLQDESTGDRPRSQQDGLRADRAEV